MTVPLRRPGPSPPRPLRHRHVTRPPLGGAALAGPVGGAGRAADPCSMAAAGAEQTQPEPAAGAAPEESSDSEPEQEPGSLQKLIRKVSTSGQIRQKVRAAGGGRGQGLGLLAVLRPALPPRYARCRRLSLPPGTVRAAASPGRRFGSCQRSPKLSPGACHRARPSGSCRQSPTHPGPLPLQRSLRGLPVTTSHPPKRPSRTRPFPPFLLMGKSLIVTNSVCVKRGLYIPSFSVTAQPPLRVLSATPNPHRRDPLTTLPAAFQAVMNTKMPLRDPHNELFLKCPLTAAP